MLIAVSPSPGLRVERAIAGSLDSLLNDLGRNGFEIVSPSDLGEEIDESCREVHFVIAELSGFVIPREDVLCRSRED